MTKIKKFIWTAAFFLAFASPLQADTILPFFYQEHPDAGDLDHAQSLAAGSDYNGISAILGGDDKVDAFAFYYAGGGFYTQTTMVTTDTTKSLNTSLYFATFTAPGEVAPGALVEAVVQDSTSGVMGWNLEAGNYILQFLLEGSDPPISSSVFTLNPNGPDPAPPAVITAPQSVPEPSLWSLLIAGLMAAIAVARRNKSVSA
jgi:hypothetical protein